MKTGIALMLACVVASVAAEFPAVMAERNLEKRSELALKQAATTLPAAKTAYDQNTIEDFRAQISDVVALVDLSYKSLVATGKRARNKPKYWKRAEMQIRNLMRRLDDLAAEVAFEDRETVTAARKKVSDVHDQVLHDVMANK